MQLLCGEGPWVEDARELLLCVAGTHKVQIP